MPRVLLVDDDRGDLMLLQQALQEALPSLEVMPVRTRVDALLRLPEADLVLMDLNMPGTSGFELITEIRRNGGLVPILVLTTSAAQGDVGKAYDAGANGFITKPADLLETIEAMRTLCGFWFDHAALAGRP